MHKRINFHWQKSIKNKQIILTIGMAFVFLIVAIILNLKGILKDNNSDLSKLTLDTVVKKQIAQPTDLKIPQASFSGKILYTDKHKLALLNPQNLKSQTLVKYANISAPGVLPNGKIYFFSTEPDQNRQIYNHLFIQTDSGMVQFKLPLLGNDNFGRPPIVSPDARKVFFISKRQDKIHFRLFAFDLMDGQLEVVTKTAKINIDHIQMNNNGNYLAIIYHFDQQETSSIGIIATSNYTPNLYPKLSADLNKLNFSDDSRYLFYAYQHVTKVLSLVDGKEVSDTNFNWQIANDLLLFKTTKLSVKSIQNWSACKSLKNQDWGKIQVVRFKTAEHKFTRPLNSKIDNLLLQLPGNQDVSDVDHTIVNTLDNNCKQGFGILDFRNDKLQELFFNGDVDFYWMNN